MPRRERLRCHVYILHAETGISAWYWHINSIFSSKVNRDTRSLTRSSSGRSGFWNGYFMEQNLISMHSWNGNALSYTCDKFMLLLFRLVQYHHSAHSGVVIHRELAQFSCENFEFEDKNEELDQLMSILDSVSYTRSPRSFFSRNIRNDGVLRLHSLFLP